MHDLGFFYDSERHDVDQTIVVEAVVEEGIAGEIGHANGVAIAGDTGDDAFLNPAGFRGLQGPKTQSVADSDDLGSHTADIAHISANAGGRAFIGHDLGRVVVGFMANDDAIAMALFVLGYRDYTGVFFGSEDDIGAVGDHFF